MRIKSIRKLTTFRISTFANRPGIGKQIESVDRFVVDDDVPLSTDQDQLG
jgi:hypothetical protein